MREVERNSSKGLLHTIKWCPLPIFLFIITIVMPTELSVSIGSLRLSPYRFVLLFFFLPSLVVVLKNNKRLVWADITLFGAAVVSMISLSINHDLSVAIESGGVRALEMFGPYILARSYIKNEKQFWGSVSALFVVVMPLGIMAVIESVTRVHFLKNIMSVISGVPFVNLIEPRFGLDRAYSTFDHPILYGVFVSSLIGLAMFGICWVYRKKIQKLRVLIILVSTVASLSSGALAAMVMQFFLIFWARITRKIKKRWLLLMGGTGAFYVFVNLLATRSAFVVLLTLFVFSSSTAYYRILIFEYGIENVYENPWFGIGFHEWSRPAWMASSSVDNFWLVEAMTYGVPNLVLILISIWLVVGRFWSQKHSMFGSLRFSYTLGLAGMMMAGCTVHFWNNLFVYFFFYVGMGAWFPATADIDNSR